MPEYLLPVVRTSDKINLIKVVKKNRGWNGRDGQVGDGMQISGK
jgi:hypothetical protein